MASYCDRCQNTGEVDCYCGGDLCICTNYGTMICPACGGDCFDDDDDYWPLDEPEGAPAPTTHEEP